MAPLNAPQVAIADLDLVEKVQLVDKLGDKERQLVKNVMDLVVMKGRVRALAHEGWVAKRAEPETATAPGAT